MYFITLAAVFLVPAMAKPQEVSARIPTEVLSQMTVKEANDACGAKQSINCCNSVKQGDNTNESSGVLSGLLSGVLADGVSLVDQCSKIDVTAGMLLTCTH